MTRLPSVHLYHLKMDRRVKPGDDASASYRRHAWA
jgi:hypothetical protein